MAHIIGLRPLMILTACIMSTQATAMCLALATASKTAAGSGVRLLVSLKSEVQVEPGSGDGSVDNPWKLMQ